MTLQIYMSVFLQIVQEAIRQQMQRLSFMDPLPLPNPSQNIDSYELQKETFCEYAKLK